MLTVRASYLNAVRLFPLSFKDPALERRFLGYHFEINLTHGRLCHILAIFFFVADGLRDRFLFPDMLPTLMIIRYAYIVPVFIAGLAASYIWPIFYQRYWQPLFASYVLVTGSGALALILAIPAPFGPSMYIGVIYCLVFGYTFIRLRFLWAAASGTLITAAYLMVSIWGGRLSTEVMWLQFPFVVGVNLLGMFVAYHIEFSARREFYFRELLTAEKEKLDAVNDDLERRVAERTQELAAANATLQTNLNALKRSENERAELETHLQQAHKMEAIGTLAGGIAHDFNNILSSVIGYTELALGDVGKNHHLDSHLRKVLVAGNRAKELVKQILTFARQSDEDIKPIQVHKIADEVLKLLRSTIPSNVDIRASIDTDALILGNATQVHQIFLNLCTNAAQAMEPEGGTLTIRLEETEPPSPLRPLNHETDTGRCLCIIVSDTGHGIDERTLPSIFEPYFTTKPTGEGTGMGLALVHGIVQSYGGAIMVDSHVGQGTTFTIHFPIVARHADDTPRDSAVLPTGSEHILFVDDDDAIVGMMEGALVNMGYRVTTCDSSVDALSLFHAIAYDVDLVISDMTMPVMTGDKLAVEMLKIRSDIPIILSTGYSKSLSADHANEIGIRKILNKPVALMDLARTIRDVLDNDQPPSGRPDQG